MHMSFSVWKKKMSGGNATILCYWNGNVKEGPEGIDYSGGRSQLIKVSSQISYVDLLSKIYTITGWDKGNTRVKMTGRLCTHSSPRHFVGTSIVNDESLSALFDMLQCDKIHCIELYLRHTRIDGKARENLAGVEGSNQSSDANPSLPPQRVLNKSYMCPVQNVCPGPKDTSVLKFQKDHRSSDVWENKLEVVHSPIRVRSGRVWTPHQDLHRCIMDAGFLGVMQIQSIPIDHALMTALIERWRQETHTFHFSVGEMTVTLQDVAMLLGLPIDGDAVTGSHGCDWALMCETELGLRPGENDIHGSSLQLKWLADNFSELPGADNEDVNEYNNILKQFARAWLLAVIGTVLCPSTSGDSVSLSYLSLLKDLREVHKYSWGSAVLANLYRGLCRASKRGAKELSGCALLLQLWSWERLHIGRPRVTEAGLHVINGGNGNEGGMGIANGDNADGGNEDAYVIALHPDVVNSPYARVPYGYRWTKPRSFVHNPRRGLHYYRSELDSQKTDEVQWQPYERVNEADVSPFCFAGRNIWRAEVPLICYDVVEWYFPNRVLRQFGCVQGIPGPCKTDVRLHNIDKRGRHKMDWSLKHHYYVSEWIERHNRVFDAERIEGEPRNWDKYLQWYRKITRLFIARPEALNQPNPSLQYHGKSALWHRLAETLVTIARASSRSLGTRNLDAEAREGYRNIRSLCVSALKDAGELDRLENSQETAQPSTSRGRKTTAVRESGETSGGSRPPKTGRLGKREYVASFKQHSNGEGHKRLKSGG